MWKPWTLGVFCGFLLTVDVIRKYRCMICFEKLGPIYRYIFGILIGPATRKLVRTGTLSVIRSPVITLESNWLPRVTSFTLAYIVKSCEIFLLLKIRTMATNFSPCKGSYVLNQFPSNVMFGMNGFHVSASGAIQGHHGPLVLFIYHRYQLPIWALPPGDS